jgi:RNA polymerase sigma-70 factor (ECF subfamily)
VVARDGKEEFDDTAIVRGLRAGEDWAARLAWNRHAPMVYGVLDRALGRAGESEDLTQEVFCRVFAAIGSLRDPSAFRSYIYSATLRILRWHLRSKRIRQLLSLSDSGELPDHAYAGHDPEGRDLLARFYRLLDRIPTDDRTAYVLRHVEGLQLDEISRATGASLATVKRRVRRAAQEVAVLVKAEPDLAPYFERAGGAHET